MKSHKRLVSLMLAYLLLNSLKNSLLMHRTCSWTWKMHRKIFVEQFYRNNFKVTPYYYYYLIYYSLSPNVTVKGNQQNL